MAEGGGGGDRGQAFPRPQQQQDGGFASRPRPGPRSPAICFDPIQPGRSRKALPLPPHHRSATALQSHNPSCVSLRHQPNTIPSQCYGLYNDEANRLSTAKMLSFRALQVPGSGAQECVSQTNPGLHLPGLRRPGIIVTWHEPTSCPASMEHCASLRRNLLCFPQSLMFEISPRDKRRCCVRGKRSTGASVLQRLGQYVQLPRHPLRFPDNFL